MDLGKPIRRSVNRLSVVMACACTALLWVSMRADACDPVYYDLTMQIQDEAQNPGTVSPPVGVTTYASGTEVTLEATPNTGWLFDHWSSGGQDIDTNPLTIVMDSDKVVTAVFAVDSTTYYTLTITQVGEGVVDPAPGMHTYAENTSVPVSATDVTDWKFDRFEGALTGSTTPQSVLMDSDKSVTAFFIEQFELSTSVIGMGGIDVAPDQAEYNSGALVVLTAQPDTGHHLKEWSGDLTGHENPELLLMDSDKSVTATFVEPFTLTLTPTNQISASPTGPQYVPHTVVTLTANPGMGEIFSHWVAEGEPIDFSRSNPATITMDDNKTVNAVFVSSSTTFHPLTITTQGNGTVLPVSGSYPENTQVRLTAYPGANARLHHWEGAETETGDTTTVTMDGAKTVVAHFIDTHELTTSVVGDGTVTPGSGTYDHMTNVLLTAIPDPGNAFDYWVENDVTLNTGPIYTTLMDQDKNVVAHFVPGNTLDAYAMPSENAGVIKLSPDYPGGSVNGNHWTECYLPDSEVTISAEYVLGYAFDHWTIDGVQSEAGPVHTLVMDTDHSAYAQFTAGYVLEAAVYPDTDHGSIGFDPDHPGGEQVDNIWRESFLPDSEAIVSAVANVGYVFDHWEQDALPIAGGPEYSVLMDQDQSLDCYFNTGYVVTALVKPESDMGTVEYAPDYPGGLADDGVFKETYYLDTLVAMTAVPEVGYVFHRWEQEGQEVETDNTLVLTVEDHVSYDAKFAPGKTLTAAASPAVGGTILMEPDPLGGTLENGVRMETFATDAVVEVTPSAAYGYVFDHWEGALTGSQVPATVTMDDDKAITAVFVLRTWTVTASAGGEGSGSVTPTQATYTHGDLGSLSATADSGYGFLHWEGDLTSTENPVSFTVTKDMDVTGIFSPYMTLNTQVVGQGSVTKDPDLTTYVGGATVQLTATPAVDWNFDHWECPGDLSVDGATASPINVVVDYDAKTVTAVFRSAQDMDVSALGGGTVAVNPDPSGGTTNVSGGPETFHYTTNTTVALTPTPDTGREMDYWVNVSKLNTATINYNTGPLEVMTVFCRSATAMFKAEEGETDTETDFVLPVLGPGEVIIDYENDPDQATSQVISGSVPAGETVTATAVAADPEEGIFSCWQVVVNGETTYVTDETIEITSDTTATAIYHEYADPETSFVSPVTTRVRGQGSINIGEGTFMFSTYNTPDNPLSGFGTIHLFATAAPGWVFKRWHNAPGDPTSPHVNLSLVGNYDVTAEFVERPGIDTLDFVMDLGTFLVDVNFNSAPLDVQNLDFDTGEVEFNTGGMEVMLLPNDLPDAAELALLQGVLQESTFEQSDVGGASNTGLWDDYQSNLTQAQLDLPSMGAYIQRLTAAYMTLGTFGHRETMPYYLDEAFGIGTVDPDNYELFGARYFNARGDVDNDGVWNIEEWQNAVISNGDVADMTAVALFVEAAMDPESDGLDQDDGLEPDEFEHEGAVYVIGSVEHLALVEEATGANSEYLPKTTLTLSMGETDTKLDFKAYVIDPPGYETVPLTGGAITCALGREIRVCLNACPRWFTTWYAPNTLIHGSGCAGEVFRLGNTDQVVRARKRQYESMTVYSNPKVNLSCAGVGPLAEEVYSEPDPQGGTKYFVPEDTALGVSVTNVSSEWGESCVTGSMSLRGWHGDNLTTVSSLRSWGLFNPAGMGVVSPGACCCDGGGECLCDVYGWYTYYPHTFDGGPGGRMVASPGLLDTQDEPYQAHGCITKSYGDGPFGHELKFEWFGWPGFQYGCTRVYSADGALVDTVYPMLGSKGTTVANRATAPLYALADSIPQPTLDVDIEVEENLVPPAIAGHYTFDNVNYAGGKKYYIYETYYPEPYPDKLTELVAVSLNRNDGFVLKSWTGNCAYYDANGNYLGMLPESLPEDPDDWVTGDTIYVKCLKAVGTQTASAMTDMAVLAGATAEGAAEQEFLPLDVVINALVKLVDIELAGVEFTSDHGVLRDETTDWVDVGDVYEDGDDEWEKDPFTGTLIRNNPISHTMDTKLEVEVELYVKNPVAAFEATLYGNRKGTNGAIKFESPCTIPSGPHLIDVSLTAAAPLVKDVVALNESIEWELKIGDGEDAIFVDLGKSGKHKMYVTFGPPDPPAECSEIRLSKVCEWAHHPNGSDHPVASVRDFADGLGFDAVGQTFNDNSIGWPSTDSRHLATPWEVVPRGGDCISQVKLMRKALGLAGVPTAQRGDIYYIYARTQGWAGLRSTGAQDWETSTQEGRKCILCYVNSSGKSMKWEACLYILGYDAGGDKMKYWMGGRKTWKHTALEVLHDRAGKTDPRQYWYDDHREYTHPSPDPRGDREDYPIGSPPTY